MDRREWEIWWEEEGRTKAVVLLAWSCVLIPWVAGTFFSGKTALVVTCVWFLIVFNILGRK